MTLTISLYIMQSDASGVATVLLPLRWGSGEAVRLWSLPTRPLHRSRAVTVRVQRVLMSGALRGDGEGGQNAANRALPGHWCGAWTTAALG